MNKNQKKRQLNRGLSIALALLLAVTVSVTIIAFASSSRKKPSESTNTSETSNTETTSSTTTTATEKPTDNPVVAKPDEIICPVSGGVLGKVFSADVPVWSLTMEDYRVHSGIDITADAGTAVMACADGTITEVKADPMMGQTITITHAEGYQSIYKNLQTKLPENIKIGTKVSAGDTIGYVGDTALVEISDSPHLHFEFIGENVSVDPLTFFAVPVSDSTSNYED